MNNSGPQSDEPLHPPFQTRPLRKDLKPPPRQKMERRLSNHDCKRNVEPCLSAFHLPLKRWRCQRGEKQKQRRHKAASPATRSPPSSRRGPGPAESPTAGSPQLTPKPKPKTRRGRQGPRRCGCFVFVVSSVVVFLERKKKKRRRKTRVLWMCLNDALAKESVQVSFRTFERRSA